LAQLRSGQSLKGKDGAFAPLLKEFLGSALQAEMDVHLDEQERKLGNKKNGRGVKTLKTSLGSITIETPQDRLSSLKNNTKSLREK